MMLYFADAFAMQRRSDTRLLQRHDFRQRCAERQRAMPQPRFHYV